MSNFENLTDRDLESVAGGLSSSVDFAKGVSLDSKLLGKTELAFPKPSDVLSGLKSTITKTLDNAGKLLDLGQLFDFI